MFDAVSHFITSGLLYSTLLWIALVWTFIIIIVILSENRDPVKSLAWVTILLLLPVVGLILYLFFGRNIKNQRMISRSNRRKLRRGPRQLVSRPEDFDLSPSSVGHIKMGRSLSGAHFYGDNSVEIFYDGRQMYDTLAADLEKARHSINFQFYIFSDDKEGKRLAEILERKAREGVEVRILYDHVGSFTTSGKFFKRLKKAGVRVHPFFKVTFPIFGTHVNWRNHRKLVTVDDTVAYLGGMNIAGRYVSDEKNVWRDTHTRVIGPVVNDIRFSFAVDWNFTTAELIPQYTLNPEIIPSPESVNGVGAHILSSGPMDQWSNISMLFHRAIANAQNRIYIQTPYFLPTQALMNALASAALAKVDVRIMLPLHSDSLTLNHASASYIAECLRSGIKIYFYIPGMLHAKTMVVDDEFVTIGSTNFDFRSFDYNFESNLFFYSKELNKKVAEQFHKDMEYCERVSPHSWRKRPFMKKVAESVLRLLAPIL